jgi:hypothetical protein
LPTVAGRAYVICEYSGYCRPSLLMGRATETDASLVSIQNVSVSHRYNGTKAFTSDNFAVTRSRTRVALALFLDGEDRLGSDFESGFRYRIAACIGVTIGALCDLLQSALDIVDAAVVHVM